MFARDLVQFGCILGHWQELVGQDVYAHAWPTQLIQGKLSLICNDSQWLHHLRFLKSDILRNLKNRFPEIPVREIFGRVGVLPPHPEAAVPQHWPEWKQEAAPTLPPMADSELRERISRCAQKAQARMKGLLEHGYKFCSACQTSIIPNRAQQCGVCLFKQRDAIRRRIRGFLSDHPWYSFEQILSEAPEATQDEYDLTRRDLILETRERISVLGNSWQETADDGIRSELEREIVREIMLASQISPDQISLHDQQIQPLLDPEWIRWLNQAPDEVGSC